MSAVKPTKLERYAAQMRLAKALEELTAALKVHGKPAASCCAMDAGRGSKEEGMMCWHKWDKWRAISGGKLVEVRDRFTGILLAEVLEEADKLMAAIQEHQSGGQRAELQKVAAAYDAKRKEWREP